MTCTLTIKTTNTDTWYTVPKSVNLDGGSASKYRAYETFINTGTKPSQFTNSDIEISQTQADYTLEILILDATDLYTGGDGSRKRVLPFVSGNTDGTATDP